MAGQSTAPAEAAISFGAFRLYPRRQLLLQGDKPVRLGSRALDVLTALVERAGEVVTKKELIARVWPETFVGEGNLRVHIAGLRRALGDGQAGQRYVANVPGRGYRFVASVVVSEARMPIAPVSTPTPAHNLPARLTHMIGRDAVVDTIAAQLPQRRLITIAGPGGIGKTTVALAVADRLLPGYRDGVRFIELASVAGDPASLLTAVASALGAPAGTADAAAITAFLRDKELLLVLDSCEHTIEAAATFAVDALRTAPGLSILATSREPMRAEGERVQRLAPLDAPPPSCNPTASEALASPRSSSWSSGCRPPSTGSS